MTKRLASLILAIAMFLQIIAPQAIFAKEEVKAPEDGLVTVGVINGDSYDAKLMLELNRLTAKNRVKRSADPGASLFGYFDEGQEPKDEDKLKYHGEVKAILSVNGLDGKQFQWNEIFGAEEVHLRFIQINDDTGVETGTERVLNISKAGTYTWTDGEGNPAELPLFNNKLEPLTYEVKLDEEVSDKVKLLTARLTTTGNAGTPTFDLPDNEGRIKYHLTLEIGLQQVASSKFVSEWHTAVVEGERPQLEGTMTGSMDVNGSPKNKTINLKLPKNDNDEVIVKAKSRRDKNKLMPEFLFKTPTTDIKTDTTGLTFDTTNKTVTSGDHKFKYDFKYDVINGGKLTMTEIIPVTFEANGGKFANFTAPDTETKIVKEVDYDGTLTDKAENPTKQGKAFKGWATDANGTTPAPESEYANLTAAKTFYAIWSDEDIQAEELVTSESLIIFRSNNRPPIITNDFVPTFDELKAQVKVKDAGGNFVALPADVTFSIVDGTKEYTEQSDDLKKFIYDKVKENRVDEVSRTEKVKAKIKYSDGTTREIEIPIKVLKNIYRGSDQGNKLPHIPNDYVRVTIDPTNKAQDPQKTYYYVNPAAKVIVPVTNPVGKDDNKFSKWTMKADSATGDGADYTTGKRQIYTENSTITAQYGTGTIKIQCVDQNGDEIDKKYQILGNDYPSDKSGGLGKEADELQFAKKGPDFKGYIYSSRDTVKGKHYKDPTDPDKLDVVKYSYYKKVTTKEPTNKNVYFPVIFDANGGEFKPDTVTQKTVYVYFDGNNATVEKVTFKEVKDEFEKAYSNPTKDGFDFKEWQNAKTNGTKPADDYEIQFKGWDPSTYMAKKEIFYAYYEEPGALVKYLDLDGKPIADDFKIDGVEYPTEKTGTLDEAIASDVFTKDTAPKFIGYKFNRIEINPVNSKYALDNKGTIKIYYEKLPDVIPAKDGSGNPNKKPDGYVEVKFVPTDKAKDTTEKIFYVNPKKDVTIPIADPEAKATYTFKEWKMGANADGAVYTPRTAQKFTEATTVITATYEETENIIPYDPVENPTTRPDGYVRVTFVAEKGLNLDNVIHYYVKKNAGIKLENTELVKPVVKAETGYEFVKWDPEDTTEITDTDIVVTAKAKELDSFIPADGNTKPEGYVTVTFVAGDHGSLKGVQKYYVNPTKYVAFNPPEAIGNTGYEFASWSQNSAQKTNYTKDTTIKATFNQIGAVSLVEKPGYVRVDFMIKGKGGSILNGQTKTYYVDPNRDVMLKAPVTSADVGYEFDSWSPDPAVEKKYTGPTTIEGTFKKLDDIIPKTDDQGNPNTKPDGYVTLTFEKGNGGKTITGQTIYYVNPKADPAKTLADITKPNVTPDTGYTFEKWDTEDSFEIKADKTVTATYEELPLVSDTQVPGYVTVTFDTTSKGVIEGTTNTEKIVYVNPNKPVILKGHEPNITPTTNNVFARWDVNLEKETFFKDGDKVTAQYYDKNNISVTEVPGFVKVVFDKGEHGELSGTQTYWVKPGVDVTVPAPTVNPSTGYEFNNWDQKLSVNLPANSPTYTIKAEYKALEDIIEGDKIKPNGYVKVEFVSDGNGKLIGTTSYYVNPNKTVDLTSKADAIFKNPNVGYTEIGGSWSNAESKKLKDTFSADTSFKYNFKELPSVDTTNHPGYVKVEFIAGENGQIVGGNKTYYVNPNKNIVVDSADLPIPETNANTNYVFDKWFIDIDKTNPVTSDKTYIALFKLSKVTLTYVANDRTSGTVPAALSYDIGTEITLAGGNDLKKDNYVLTGWKIGDKTYTPGEKFTINDNTTATAVWEAGVHTVNFDTVGGTHIDSQQVKHNALITPVDAPKKDGFFFTGWTLNGQAFDPTKDKVTEDITLVAQYTQDVIEQKDPANIPNVPKNFVKVTFVPTDNAKDNTNKIFWVNSAKEVTIPVKDPVGKDAYSFKEWKIGEKADGDSYNPKTPKKFTEATTITATYTESDDIIPFDPKAEDPMVRRKGYVKVTFDADLGLKLTESKAYYVKKTAGITLKTIKEAALYGYPKYKEASGYEFVKWDKDDSTIINEKDIVVTALAKYTPCEPGYRPSYPEIIYRDKIVEKVVEKIVKVGDNDELLKEIRYMQGFNGKFRPYDGLTRAEAAQILANALKADGYRYDANYALSYSDVGNVWYTDAVRVVTQAGVFQGYSDGTFRPQGKITRAEWVATLRRFQDLKKASGNTMMLRSGHWATEEVEAAYQAGWLGVYQDGTAKFDADKPITRQEVAYVSNRAFRRVLDKVYLKRSVNTLLTYKDINPSMPLYEDILCASNTLLTDNRYYKANTIVMDNVTFNIVTDMMRISQKKFQTILR